MPPRPAAGAVAWSALFLGFLLSFAAAFALHGEWPVLSRPVAQPISFNHRLHVEQEEMSCEECHRYCETETFSGLPSGKLCALCHIEPQGESKAEARLVELLQSGSELEWQPLFEQPPHVFYSHRRHVVVAGIECQTCHGDIAQSDSPPVQVRRLTMDDCRNCHEKSGASTECTACHR